MKTPTRVIEHICILLLAGCQFDSSKLEERECAQGATCATGYTCCQGYCLLNGRCPDMGHDSQIKYDQPKPDANLALDKDGDGKVNSLDNCPSTYNPGQSDADGDKVGDVCDCAPYNRYVAHTTFEIGSFSSPVPFTPVDQASDWQLVSGVYIQHSQDKVRRAAHNVFTGLSNAMALVKLQLRGQGDDGLTTPAKPVSMAGLILRSSKLAPGAGNGYYCGLDIRNGRLVIGETTGNDLGQGKLPLHTDPDNASDPPGRKISNGVQLNRPYTIMFEVRGDELICQVLLTDNVTTVETKLTDTTLTTGGMALFTVGASARFDTVKLCTP